MVLQFELFSQAQDAKVLHLLQAPWLVALHEGAAGPLRLKVWRGDKRKEVRAPSLREIIAKLQRKNLNAVDILGRHADKKGRSFPYIGGGELELSSTNALWSNPSEWEISAEEKIARSTMESKWFIERTGIKSYPTIVLFSVRLPLMSTEDALGQVEQQFLQHMNAEVASGLDYGYAILYREPEEDEASYPLLPSLASRAPIFHDYLRDKHLLPLFGERFDALHPVSVGRSQLCNQVAEAVIQSGHSGVHLSDERFGFRVLRLPLEAVNDPRAQEAAASYFLPRPTPFDRATMG